MNKKQQIPDIVRGDILFRDKSTDAMSNDEIMTILSNIIEREIGNQTPNESLVEECSRLLEELTPSHIKLTPQELADNLCVLRTQQNAPTKKRTQHRRLSTWKVLPLVAALVLLLCLSLNVVALKKGYKNAWDFVSQKASYLFHLDAGTAGKNGEIAFFKMGKTTVYESLEELLKQEAFDILYPTVLPQNVFIKGLNVVETQEGDITIHLVFNDKNYSLAIRTAYKHDFQDASAYTVYESDGKTYYILERPNRYQAVCHHGKYEYVILAPDSDRLKDIIHNLKESPIT